MGIYKDRGPCGQESGTRSCRSSMSRPGPLTARTESRGSRTRVVHAKSGVLETASETQAPGGWHGSIHQFLATDQESWLASLQQFHVHVMRREADAEQIDAWKNCWSVLQKV